MSIETRLHAVEEYLKILQTQAQQNVVQKSGDTMTGNLNFEAGDKIVGMRMNEGKTNTDVGWDYASSVGAGIGFRSVDWPVEEDKGSFDIYARSSSDTKHLIGKTNGSLLWNGYEIPSIAEKKAYNGTNGNVWGVKWVDGRMTINYYFHTLTKSSYATWNNMNGYYHTINWISDIGWSFKDTNYCVTYSWRVGSGFAVNAGELQRTTGKTNVYALSSASGSQAVNISVHIEGFWK